MTKISLLKVCCKKVHALLDCNVDRLGNSHETSISKETRAYGHRATSNKQKLLGFQEA